ncbi:major facilitator superfamily domain-containing protein, partial [Lipomyces chichibuensis]|uniref:major facilitator superfamily domain-containing protein n=1 Tax=Lipomyces chichibuensis TaxID=1546026 RepID=UPI0033440422
MTMTGKTSSSYILGILQPVCDDEDVTGTVAMIPHDETTKSGHAVSDYVNENSSRSKRPEKIKNGVILHPQPKDDPNDPLNWPTWRRDMALAVIGFHCMIGGGQTPILAAGFSTLAAEFNVSLSTLAYLVGGYMLALGFGSVIISPTAILYGKRVTYLLGTIIFLVAALWASGSHSFASLLAARIFMGFGVAPCESLPSATIAEIYFLHERAYRLGIYTLLLLGGKNIVPLISGFIISNLGWNWVFWIVAIIVGFDFVMIFLFVPETWFERNAVPHDKRQMETASAREASAQSLKSRSRSSVHSSLSAYPEYYTGEYSDIDERVVPTDMPMTEEKKSLADEKADSLETRSVTHSHLRQRSITTVGMDIGVPSSSSAISIPPSPPASPAWHAHSKTIDDAEADDVVSILSAQKPKKSFKDQLAITNGRLSNDPWWKVALRPLVLFAYPAVLFSTLMYALSVVWLIVMSESVSDVFEQRPYNMSATAVGLLYISPFVGGILGTAVAGKISDMIVRVMTKRNNGTYEPEFRLLMVVAVAVSVAIGLMGFGWSAYDDNIWVVPTVFFGIISFGCCLGSTTAITFAVDSYKMYAGEALVTLNLTKNVLGFVFSLFTNNFIEHAGTKTTFITFGCVQLFVCLLAIPLYMFGKVFRRWTDQKQLMRYL